ncbi:hypothetical protein [uncultured Thermus sp.]|uniref:type III-A CRISPR-associated RAMP protein Csm4 n=1 Tax=uncultured Thermus sp. TaxID=157149 RepID=UPI0026310606|nr:hypothetical protein [uncultured Thermus sp.]
MRVKAYYLRFQGGLRSLPRAPTLMGHLFWWYRYTHGRQALEDLLERYRVGRVSFRLSSAFPRGWLPRPKLSPLLVEETKLRKNLKALQLLSLETFAKVAEKGEEALLHAPELAEDLKERLTPPLPKRLRRVRVGIDRGTGGARQGILFAQDFLFPQGEYAVYTLGEAPFPVREGLEFVGEMGYGGLASVGLGVFQVVGEEDMELPEAPGANAFVSLAPGPLEGALHYDLEAHWGRLGGGYVGAKPFKKSYLRTKEGSVYREDPGPRLLDLTPDPPPEDGVKVYEVLQVFPLGVRV